MKAWIFQDRKQLAKLGDACPWSVGWYDPDGKRKSKTIGTRALALQCQKRIDEVRSILLSEMKDGVRIRMAHRKNSWQIRYTDPDGRREERVSINHSPNKRLWKRGSVYYARFRRSDGTTVRQRLSEDLNVARRLLKELIKASDIDGFRKRHVTPANTRNTPVGVINANEAYELHEFASRMRLGEFALREVRAKGLKVVEVGRRRYVLGKHWMEFLEKQPNAPVTSNTNRVPLRPGVPYVPKYFQDDEPQDGKIDRASKARAVKALKQVNSIGLLESQLERIVSDKGIVINEA